MMNKEQSFFAKEKAKTQGMTKREKAQYIWQYFKIPIVAIVIFIGLGVFLAVRIVSNIPDKWIAVIFANTTANVGNDSQLWKSFTQAEQYDLNEKRVDFNAESYFDYTKHEASGNPYFNAFTTLADAGELDAITMESESLAALGQSGRLMDLNNDKCKSLREKYQDRFIYYEPAEDDSGHTESIPVGIDISDSLLMSEYHIYPETCAIGVIGTSSNIEQVEDFIAFVLGEE